MKEKALAAPRLADGHPPPPLKPTTSQRSVKQGHGPKMSLVSTQKKEKERAGKKRCWSKRAPQEPIPRLGGHRTRQKGHKNQKEKGMKWGSKGCNDRK